MLVLGAVAASCEGKSRTAGAGTGGEAGAGRGGSETSGGTGGTSAGDGGIGGDAGMGGGDAGAGGDDAGAGGNDSGAGGSDSGAGGSYGGSPDGGASGTPQGTIIIDRPPRLEQDCTVVRPPTLLGVDWSGADLGVTANGAFILHVTPSAGDLVLSSLDPDGTFETVHVETGVTVSEPTLHARPSGLSAAWRDDDLDDIATADFDADGLPTRAIRLIDAPSDSSEPRIIATDGGYALLTTWRYDSEAGDIQFTALDADGARVAPPVTVYEGLFVDSGGIHSNGFVAVPGGFLAQFLHTSEDIEDHPGAYILPLDEQGSVRGSDLGSPWDEATAMLALGDELFAMFEVNKTRLTCVLGLGRLNLSTLMRTAPDAGIFETLPRMPWATYCTNPHIPRLFTIGENVGLHWREPGVSRFVLLARNDLTPVSRVVELPDLPPEEGSVSDVDVQALGSDILVVTTYSLPGMSSRGASATITCLTK
jgi:hypothetical protein